MDNTELALEPLEWFSHDSGARNSLALKRLKKRFGIQGIGRWWILCEILAEAKGHRVNVENLEWLYLLADELMCTPKECDEFIRALADMELLDAGALDEGYVFSNRMFKNALYRAGKSNAGRKGGKAAQAKK